MSLPTSLKDLEVPLKTDPGKAVIEGKTAVPFQALVGLILQRKVFSLFKDWGKEPIILGSELLTSLASAPQDSHENRGHLILVTLGMGMVLGILLTCGIQVVLLFLGFALALKELLVVIVSILGVGVIVWLLSKTQTKGGAEKVTETMEKVAGFLK